MITTFIIIAAAFAVFYLFFAFIAYVSTQYQSSLAGDLRNFMEDCSNAVDSSRLIRDELWRELEGLANNASFQISYRKEQERWDKLSLAEQKLERETRSRYMSAY